MNQLKTHVTFPFFKKTSKAYFRNDQNEEWKKCLFTVLRLQKATKVILLKPYLPELHESLVSYKIYDLFLCFEDVLVFYIKNQ